MKSSCCLGVPITKISTLRGERQEGSLSVRPIAARRDLPPAYLTYYTGLGIRPQYNDGIFRLLVSA